MESRGYKNRCLRICKFSLAVFFLLTVFIFPCAAEPKIIAKFEPTIVFPILAPRLSSGYGNRAHPIFKAVKHHSGIDLAAPEKSHVRSVSEGVVIFAGILPGYGKVVSVKHNENYVSVYGHLSQIETKLGETIAAGTVIGRVGHTGHATGPHLHFEWRKDGKPLDPLRVFPEIASDPVG